MRTWSTPGPQSTALAKVVSVSRHTAEKMRWLKDGTDSADRALWRKPTPPDLEQARLEQAQMLRQAGTWAVSAAMVPLIAHAAETMPGEGVERGDLPDPSGFVWLEAPLWVDGATAGQIPERALHWYRDSKRDGVTIVVYRDNEHYAHNEAVDESLGDLPPLWATTTVDWAWGDDSADAASLWAMFLKALWTITAQRIELVDEVIPDRPARRRAERAGLTRLDRNVRVVNLRRVTRPSGARSDETSVEWTHRWMVSGHWRNQWLPSRGMHRLQWIDAHVKGPDDKPFVVKTTVRNVIR